MAQRDKSWESSWQSAMEGKSVTPPAGVWDNIEKGLDNKKSRTLAPVWWSAAAAIALLAVTFIYIKMPDFQNSNVSDESSQEASSSAEDLAFENPSKDINEKEKKRLGVTDQPVKKDDSYTNTSDTSDNKMKLTFKEKEEEENIKSITRSNQDTAPTHTNQIDDRAISKENTLILKEDSGKKEVLIPDYIQGLPAIVYEIKLAEIPQLWGVPVFNNSKRKSYDEWYAGVDFSAGASGTNDDNLVMGASLDESAMDPVLNYNNQHISNRDNEGSTYAYGLNIGKKVGRRIILESGINYRRIETTSISNVAYSDGANRSVYNLATSYSGGQLTTTSLYEMENVHQFVSIPLKAGYLIIDKKWKISVNTGVSGDYFFKTSTRATSGDLQSYESNPSDNPQWNTVSISVLGELNVLRQIGDHYIISVSPQLRQALNDFSTNNNQELKPFILQVSLQLKYKFD